MKLYILLSGFSFFLICLVIHILIWRIRHPQRHALALSAIFLFPVLPMVLLIHLIGQELPLFDLVSIALLHVALSCAYIQIYPASQADSPSLRLLIHVQQSMPRGLSVEEIYPLFDPLHLFQARIQDLLSSGLVQKTNGLLDLTPKGRALILPFVLFRQMLGLPPGRG